MSNVKPAGSTVVTSRTVLRFLLLLAVPLSLPGCASAPSGEPIAFDTEQAYTFSGSVGGEDLTGVFQFEDGGDYRIYSSNGMCHHGKQSSSPVSGRLPHDLGGATAAIDLRCGSLALRLWLVDGQLQPEGMAYLTTEKRLSLGDTDRTTHTGVLTIARH